MTESGKSPAAPIDRRAFLKALSAVMITINFAALAGAPETVEFDLTDIEFMEIEDWPNAYFMRGMAVPRNSKFSSAYFTTEYRPYIGTLEELLEEVKRQIEFYFKRKYD